MIDVKDLFPRIVAVSEDFGKARNDYVVSHPGFQIERDARITIFSHCKVVIDSALLYLAFRTFQLPSDGWWDSLPNEFSKIGISKPLLLKPDPANRKLIIEAVDSFWSYGSFILLFSSLESSTRTIVRTAFRNQFNDGRANLRDIYRRLLGANFSNYECLLELLRLGRNTMHNNGVYFPETIGDNRHVPYKNKTYDFIDGQVVQYGDLPKLLFFDIAPDVLKMIIEIVNSPAVVSHIQIQDPSA
jgi:hypothetical protein